MPAIYFRADKDTFKPLLQRLNSDDHVLFIVPNGPGCWKAVREVDQLDERTHCVWHLSSGPVVTLDISGREVKITDPFSGWTEVNPGSDRSRPYFGAGHPAVFWLSLRFDGHHSCRVEWIGNYFKITGHGPAPETERWWRRLRTLLKKTYRGKSAT